MRLGTEVRLFSMIAVPRIAMPPNFSGEKLCLLARQVYNYHFFDLENSVTQAWSGG